MAVRWTCKPCAGVGYTKTGFLGFTDFRFTQERRIPCPTCKGKGYRTLAEFRTVEIVMLIKRERRIR